MSVPVNQRSHGKLEAYAKAYELATYTKREKKKLRRLVAKSKSGSIPRDKVDESYAAWRNHASKGNSFRLLQRMDEYYKNLWR